LVSTPNGPRPIESLHEGDVVYGVNHETGRIEATEVRRTFEKNAEKLVEINSVQMTPNHPIFTQRGYVRADDVLIGDTITFLDATETTAPQNLRAVRAGLPGLEADRSLLHEALLDPRARQQARQSIQDGRWNDQKQVNLNATRSGILLPEGREWSRLDRAAKIASGNAETHRFAMDAGVHLQDRESDSWSEQDLWDSFALQNRLGQRSEDDRRRVGRRGTSFPDTARTRRQENIMARIARLDSDTSSKQGRAALRIASHGTNRVFNIETGLGNYFAGGLLVHNCHHATADTYNKLMTRFSARYRLGVSATPDKTGDFELAKLVIGPIIHTTHPHQVTNLIKPRVVKVPTKFGFGFRGHRSRYQRSNYGDMVGALIANEERNLLIVRNIIADEGHHQLLVTKRLEHIEVIEGLLEENGYSEPVYRLIGKDRPDHRTMVVQAIDSEPGVLLSTLADEALDIPRLDRMHLVFPQRNAGLVVQQVGRVERQHPDKRDAVIYDYVDGNVGALDAQWRVRRTEVYMPRNYKIDIRR
jgi:hypothetical protein